MAQDDTDWMSQLASQDGYGDVPLPRPGPRTENRNAAQVDLNMTPQERDLYDRHLANLWGPGGVDNPPSAEDPTGSRSTLFQSTDLHNGKYYTLPNVYGGRKVDEATSRALADPRGFQDVGWAGLKSGKVEAKGKTFDYEGPMINHVNRSIETTSRLTGMSPSEVVKRGLIRKEIPMYGMGGAMMGGLAAQDEYR